MVLVIWNGIFRSLNVEMIKPARLLHCSVLVRGKINFIPIWSIWAVKFSFGQHILHTCISTLRTRICKKKQRIPELELNLVSETEPYLYAVDSQTDSNFTLVDNYNRFAWFFAKKRLQTIFLICEKNNIIT